MKKNYIQPQTVVIEISTMSMMATSSFSVTMVNEEEEFEDAE